MPYNKSADNIEDEEDNKLRVKMIFDGDEPRSKFLSAGIVTNFGGKDKIEIINQSNMDEFTNDQLRAISKKMHSCMGRLTPPSTKLLQNIDEAIKGTEYHSSTSHDENKKNSVKKEKEDEYITIDYSHGTMSLVSGLVGLLFAWIPFVGIVLGIIAFVQANKQEEIQHSGMAIAGYVLGCVDLVINGIVTVIFVAAGFAFATFFGVILNLVHMG